MYPSWLHYDTQWPTPVRWTHGLCQCCHLSWDAMLTTCTQLPDKDLALLSLQLTFDGSPCRNEWGVIQLGSNNTLFLLAIFGAQKGIVIRWYSTHASWQINCGHTFRSTRFCQWLHWWPCQVNYQYLWLECAPLLAIHTLSCSTHPNEPIPCFDMAALNKLKAEVKLSFLISEGWQSLNWKTNTKLGQKPLILY